MSKTVYIGMTADIMHPGLIRIINVGLAKQNAIA